MSIIFSDHAIEQIKRRKISHDVIIKAVETPDKITASYRGRKLHQLRVNGNILEVVIRIEGSQITIITAYLLEE